MTTPIPARELRETDVLAFSGFNSTGYVDGLSIDKLTRHSDGTVTVDITHIDGTKRYRTYSPAELVVVKTREEGTPE